MLNCLHHIHLICDFSDPALFDLHDQLRIYFEPRGHLTHDLFLMRPESSAYSWQCINNCDFALLLVGDSYGQLAHMGVSQLHISYLNAKTRNKPMVALIKKNTDSDSPTKESRQLADFIGLVNNQMEHIFLFDDNSDLPALIEKAYQTLQECEMESIPTLSPIDDSLPTLTEAIPPSPDMVRIVLPNTSVVDLDETLIVNCNVHAFQDGTLIEVDFSATTSWREILTTLVNTNPIFGTQGFWKTLNEIIAPQAMPIIKENYPKVHAISRCQVLKSNMLHLQDTMIDQHWIEKSTQGKDIWQITSLAKQALR